MSSVTLSSRTVFICYALGCLRRLDASALQPSVPLLLILSPALSVASHPIHQSGSRSAAVFLTESAREPSSPDFRPCRGCSEAEICAGSRPQRLGSARGVAVRLLPSCAMLFYAGSTLRGEPGGTHRTANTMTALALLFVLHWCMGVPAAAKTVTYDFDIGWVTAAPDGFARPVIGINQRWPVPTIEADVGDSIVVKARNSLGNETTGIHFHGIHQHGTAASDGSTGVTQCPIPPGESFTYVFRAHPAGTHLYHSHNRGQFPDGLRGPLIVHDPEWERSLRVDKQFSLTMSDWYHVQTPFLVHDYLGVENVEGHLPSPVAFLFNETVQPLDSEFQPGLRYLFRIATVSAVECGYVHFSGHAMEIVAVDGVPVEPRCADLIVVCSGQRYDVVLTARDDVFAAYQYIAKMGTEMLTHDVPANESIARIGNIRYGRAGLVRGQEHIFDGRPVPQRQHSETGRRSSVVADWNTQPVHMLSKDWDHRSLRLLDDITLVPADHQPLLAPVAQTIYLTVNQSYYPGIGTRIALGEQPWVEPKVPSLLTALSTGPNASQASTYGGGLARPALRRRSPALPY